MKCPICDGGGRITSLPSGMPVKCTRCNGTGEVKQTEQEYIQTCNTEQLAEYILNVWLDGALNVNAEFGLNEAQIEKHKGYIYEWLKQPHNREE